jgi:NAD(P)-dependent dehydrogenase (short-subunit alcohol dehydrogenase family)
MNRRVAGDLIGGTTTTEASLTATTREPQLLGQTVVLIGGSAGIGLETARRARAEGAEVVLAARDPGRLEQAARELGARSSAAFDASDPDALERFFDELPTPVDHVLVTAAGAYYAPLAEIDLEQAQREAEHHLWLPIRVARHAVGKVRAGGTLLFVGGTAPRPAVGLTVAGALAAAEPALIRNLALEVAPIRVNLIAAGFVDTPLSARLLGDQLDARRDELRATLPVRRVVGPEDIAALAVHLMYNTALTGGTYDIDGGQQLL